MGHAFLASAIHDPQMRSGHPEGWPLMLMRGVSRDYRSLFQLMRSPRVVVELETGAL
jgi:hypothetical protein